MEMKARVIQTTKLLKSITAEVMLQKAGQVDQLVLMTQVNKVVLMIKAIVI